MGGEKSCPGVTTNSLKGSPPHGRGKVVLTEHHHAAKRITPALAGKSIRCTSTTRLIRDHPRVGGEKVAAALVYTGGTGSPPRGWGKVGAALRKERLSSRITPAWAGKSLRCYAFCRLLGDHPRVGGEKHRILAILDCFRGSPPRRRGKGPFEADLCGVEGITPAWAGKSVSRSIERWCIEDHPRVGGEKPIVIPCRLASRGSPPHWRGKGAPVTQDDQAGGITPALAGKR